MVTSPGKGDAVSGLANGYIFFQDDVRLNPIEGEWTRWGMYGPSAASETGDVIGDDSPLREAN